MLRKNECASKKYLYVSILALFLLTTATVGAMDQYPYFDPQKGTESKMMHAPGLTGKIIPTFVKCIMEKASNHRKKEAIKGFPKNLFL